MTNNLLTTIAAVLAFVIAPAILGAASSTDWWKAVNDETRKAYARSEAMFDPISQN